MPSSIELLTAEMHMEQSTSRAADVYERAAQARGFIRQLALLRLARMLELDAGAWRAKYLCEIRLQEFQIVDRTRPDEWP